MSTTSKRFKIDLRPVLLLALPISSNLSADDTNATKVEVTPLKQALVEVKQSAPATVVSLNKAVISAQLNAQVTKVHKLVGDEVTKGEPLVSLDCREAKARQAIAQAGLNLANKALKRARSLSSSNNIAVQNLNEAETGLKQARAEARLSNIQVERCLISAPYAAAITEKLISEGELASPGTPLLRLLDTTRIEVSAQIRPMQLESLLDSQKHRFVLGNEAFELKLRTTTPAIDSQNHTIETRFRFSEKPAIAGSPGRLEWLREGNFLDSTYVQERDGQLGYFIADRDTAKFIPLPAAQRGSAPQVSSNGDTKVITTGRFSLNDGDPIWVIEASK